jgi:general secretion pathway protein A
MYEQFFGFSAKPFDMTPNPGFLFMTDSHQDALASLVYGIQERRGFISLTGEIGTGKTTLLYHLRTILDGKVRTIFIFQTHLLFEELLGEILRELRLPRGDGKKTSMIRRLNSYLLRALERKENLALLIDEAQNLGSDVLEDLRMLSNMETPEAKLMQIVLVGQPELEIKLNSEGLRQLKHRIGIRRHIRSLSEEESRLYIQQRLEKAGSSSTEIFTQDALDLIIRNAAGIFRSINILCDNAFLIGYGLKKKKIDANVVREVLGDMGMAVPRDPFPFKKVFSAEEVIEDHYRPKRWWNVP